MRRVCDLLIRGGQVIDGTGAPRHCHDVAVSDSRIVALGDLSSWVSDHVIDATGRVVAPGFIDVHTHDDSAVLVDPLLIPKVSQGVTTVVVGNCGISLAPLVLESDPTPPLDLLGDKKMYRFQYFKEYLDALRHSPCAVNVLALIGHQTLRVKHVEALDRAATSEEIRKMAHDVAEAMLAGAAGFSSGLEYSISRQASLEEVVELARVATAYQGIYCTHIRDEQNGVIEAIEEALLVGRQAGIPVILSHHKVAGAQNHGRSRETLALISAAASCQEVGFDVYPYAAGSSSVTPSDLGEFRITVTRSLPHPELVGMDLADIASLWSVTEKEAVERLAPVGGIYHLMKESDVETILAHPCAMIGSDGLPFDPHPHPRLWGTFPRVLGHYARDRGLIKLEEAVRRMTGLPAETFGLPQRGLIEVDYFADLVIFDPDSIVDTATYEIPKMRASGIDAVIVNGICVWREGEPTGCTPGRVLKRQATQRQ